VTHANAVMWDDRYQYAVLKFGLLPLGTLTKHNKRVSVATGLEHTIGRSPAPTPASLFVTRDLEVVESAFLEGEARDPGCELRAFADCATTEFGSGTPAALLVDPYTCHFS
jgi:hypothetical protein